MDIISKLHSRSRLVVKNIRVDACQLINFKDGKWLVKMQFTPEVYNEGTALTTITDAWITLEWKTGSGDSKHVRLDDVKKIDIRTNNMPFSLKGREIDAGKQLENYDHLLFESAMFEREDDRPPTDTAMQAELVVHYTRHARPLKFGFQTSIKADVSH